MKKHYLTSLFFVLIYLSVAFGQVTSTFYDINTIQSIELQFEEEKWNYILDSLRYNGDDFLLGKAIINGQTFDKVGIRYAATRAIQIGSKRNTLEIFLNPENGNRQYDGINAIKLSIALRDPSLVREVLSYEIYRKYISAPRANFARLVVNEEYVGLFINIEMVDDQFLKDQFQEEMAGPIYKSTPNWFEKEPNGCKHNLYASLKYEKEVLCYDHNFDVLNGNQFEPLQNLTQILNEDPENIDAVLDVDETLWMLALNNVLVNLYSYSGRYHQNYTLYQDSKGIFHPIPGEMNLSFGSFKNVGEGSDFSLNELQRLDPLLHQSNENFPLISQLLKDDYNRKLYISHIRTILADFFDNDEYATRAKAFQSLVKEAFLEDPYKSYEEDDFNNSLTKTIGKRSRIPGLEELMKGRIRFLNQNNIIRLLPPNINEVEAEKRAKFSNNQLKEFRIHAKIDRFPEQVTIFYRFNKDEAFQSVLMQNDGKNYDEEANDDIFGVVIQPDSNTDKIEYYIVAENARALSFSPANYVNSRHETSLAIINE